MLNRPLLAAAMKVTGGAAIVASFRGTQGTSTPRADGGAIRAIPFR